MAATVPAVDLLRRWLDLEGLSQRALAERLGCSESLLWAWMSGRRRPSLDYAAAIDRISLGRVPMATWAHPEAVEKICTDGIASAG